VPRKNTSYIMQATGTKTIITPQMQPASYTGEGFPGERLLAVTALLLGVFSTVMIIKVTFMQHEISKYELEKIRLKKQQDNIEGSTYT
jgi:hypothetical protein